MNHFLKIEPRILLKLVFLLASVHVFGPGDIAAQQAASGSANLARIEFEGIQRWPRERLLKVSGLEVGQTIDVEALDAAAQRLVDSGLVKKLSYRLHTKANQATVTFQIEEGRGGEHPVIFDNFVWFTDEELANAVRGEVPSFNGTAPDLGNTADAITRALQLLLSQHKISGKIEYMPSGDLSGNISGHVFSVRGVKMPICTLHFPGAQNVDEARLIKSSKDLLGTDYSRTFAGAFAYSNLFPIYRELGQLRATFGKPVTKAETTATCNEGVELTIPVDEGAIYVWEKSEWSGNQVLTPQELDAALSMKSGEVANGFKFDKGIVAVHKAYGRKGYIAVSLRPQPDFDDAARKVTYRLEVKEGPQFHMGNLIIKGFSQSLGNYLRGKWEMKAGEVYDQGYAEDFFKNEFREVMRKVAEERQAQGKPVPRKVSTIATPDKNTLTVDVTFELGD